MAAKDAPAQDEAPVDDALDDDPSANAEAGVVPKGDTVDDDAESETPEVVGDVPDDSADRVDVGPPPSTPSAPLDVSQNRALFEDQVNAQAEQFAALARTAYIDAALAGKAIEIVTED